MRNLNFQVTDGIADIKDTIGLQYKLMNKADLTWEMIAEAGVSAWKKQIEEQAAKQKSGQAAA